MHAVNPAAAGLAPVRSIPPSGLSSRSAVALDAGLQLAWAGVYQHRSGGGLDWAADDHPEHAPGVGVEPVGRSRPPIAQILQLPGAVDRLEIALLLRPREAGGGLVAEADLGLDVLDLDVALALHQRRPAGLVSLQWSHRHQAALPIRCDEHVLDQAPNLLDRCGNLSACRTAHVCHRSLPVRVDATEHRRPGGRARLTELTGGALHRLHGPVQLAGIRRALWDGHRPESRGGQLQAEGGPPLPVEGGHKRVVAPADEPAPALERCLLYTSP